MKSLSLAALAFVSVLSTGCTETRYVAPQGETQEATTFDDLNQLVEGRRVSIELEDGATTPSRALRVMEDSTIYLDLNTGYRESTSSQDVQALIYGRPDRGVLQGAGIGALGGALVGLATGFALLPLRDPAEAETSKTHYVGIVGAFGTIVGASVGGGIGLSRGKDRYVYPELPRDRFSQTESSSRK